MLVFGGRIIFWRAMTCEAFLSPACKQASGSGAAFYLAGLVVVFGGFGVCVRRVWCLCSTNLEGLKVYKYKHITVYECTSLIA